MKFKFLYVFFIFFFLSLFFCKANSQSENILPIDYKKTLEEVYNKSYKDISGKNASYIPELSKVDPNLFSISIATVDGEIFSVGDSDFNFSLQSISKVFAYALALEDNKQKIIFDKIGLDATGKKFNSITTLEKRSYNSHNPYVNVGAIQTTSYIKGKDNKEKWERFFALLESMSDKKIFLSEKIYQSETESNTRNHAIAHLLKSHNMLKGDPKEVLDRYTKACSIMVTTKQLALMGATIANNGINPLTEKQVLSPKVTRHIVSQMLINGLYEKSGTWFVKIGVPAKSGVSGGILAIIPNKLAIAVFSSRLDASGTSIRGEKVIQKLSNIWGLHLLDS